MFSIVLEFAQTTHCYDYSQFNSKCGVSVQIKPDQVKVMFQFSLKHNRLGTHASDMSLVTTRTNSQICLKSLGGVSVQLKPNQIKPDQVKVMFQFGLKHNRLGTHAPDMSPVTTRTNSQICLKSLGHVSVQLKPDQIKVMFQFGLKHNRFGTHALDMSPVTTQTNSQICLKSLGGVSVQLKPDQIKPDQVK
jgi:dihydroxyacetone kinase DhaKLM complex PTS-EIIA-like component DhaM